MVGGTGAASTSWNARSQRRTSSSVATPAAHHRLPGRPGRRADGRRRLADEVAAAELQQLQAGPGQAVGQPQAGPVVVAPGRPEGPVALVEVGQVGVLGQGPDGRPVGVDQVQAAARADQGGQVADDRVLGAAVVGEHVAQHDHVQRPRVQAGVVGPALGDRDVAEAGRGDQGPGRGHGLRVGVDGLDPSLRPDRGRQRRQHRPRPAADVGHRGARPDPGQRPTGRPRPPGPARPSSGSARPRPGRAPARSAVPRPRAPPVTRPSP